MEVVDKIVLVPTTDKGPAFSNIPDKLVFINCVREAQADGTFPACRAAAAVRPPAALPKPAGPSAARPPAAAPPSPKPSPKP